MLLRDMSGVQVVFECGNGEELLTGLRDNTIDIVLLDLEMPVLDGMQALVRVKAEHPDVRVIYPEHALKRTAHRQRHGTGRTAIC